MSLTSVYNCLSHPPPRLEELVEALANYTGVIRNGCLNFGEFSALAQQTYPEEYTKQGMSIELGNFCQSTGILIEDGSARLYFDAVRAEHVIDCCKGQVWPQKESASLRLKSIKRRIERKRLRVATKDIRDELTPSLVQEQHPVDSTEEGTDAMRRDPIDLSMKKYVVFLTPIELDVWLTLSTLSVDHPRLNRFSIPANIAEFFAKFASRKLSEIYTPEHYEEVIQKFIEHKLICEIESGIVEGMRGFYPCVDWQEILVVDIKSRTEVFLDHASELKDLRSRVLKPELQVRRKDYGIIHLVKELLKDLPVWNGFELADFRLKNEPKKKPVVVSVPKMHTTIVSRVIHCWQSDAQFLFDLSNGVMNQGATRGLDVSLRKVLIDSGLLVKHGQRNVTTWSLDRAYAKTCRFVKACFGSAWVMTLSEKDQVEADETYWLRTLQAIAEGNEFSVPLFMSMPPVAVETIVEKVIEPKPTFEPVALPPKPRYAPRIVPEVTTLPKQGTVTKAPEVAVEAMIPPTRSPIEMEFVPVAHKAPTAPIVQIVLSAIPDVALAVLETGVDRRISELEQQLKTARAEKETVTAERDRRKTSRKEEVRRRLEELSAKKAALEAELSALS